MERINDGDFIIEAKVNDVEAKCVWCLVGVYASTDENIKKEQWTKIEQRKSDWDGTLDLSGRL